MFEADSPAVTIGLAASLLLLAPLAGCLEPIGEATQDALTDGNREQQASDPEAEDAQEGQQEADGEQSTQPLQEEEVTETYQTAFSSVEPGSDTIERVSMNLHADPLDKEEVIDAGLYWNARDKIAVMSFQNGTPTSDIEVKEGAMEGFLFGTVNRTAFFGVPPHIMTDYNDSASWDENAFNLSDVGASTGSTGSGDESFNVDNLFDAVDELPDDANVSWDTITYQGTQAQEIEVQHENETAYIDLRAVVDAANERPLLMEGTFENTTTNRTYLEIEFAYGEHADHEYADDLLRLEAMALKSEDGGSLMGPSVNETTNYTVLPSQNPGMIGLEEVEVHLQASGESSEDFDTKVSMPAEQGSLTTEEATVVYDDVDGDGAVSPGDEIRFTPHTNNATSWTASLYDEESELYVTPGPGLGALLLTLTGLAVLARSRFRR